MSLHPPLSVAVLGATGAVGETFIRLLEERDYPVREIRFLASVRSAGRGVRFRGKEHPVASVSREAFRGVDLVLSSTPTATSLEWAPIAAAEGAVVIDNSSAWRMDPEVPLVVPEVNPGAVLRAPKRIIANPNCSTIQLVVALAPLHRAAGLVRVVVATYQASSGKGARALAQLDAETRAAGGGTPFPKPEPHAGRLLGNVLAHDWKPGEGGYSEEEEKIARETRKILGLPELRVSVTTARVPVRVGHSEAVFVELERELSPDAARAVLAAAPGVILMDNPTPLAAVGKDEVFVGRIRRDAGVPHGLALWVVADNLRKGAATNALQIAELLAR